MGNNIQIFGRTFSDVSSITVNNTFSSAVKYVQEPIFEDITISQDYLAKQNTVINNGIIFQTDETYPGTPVVINNAAYANIPNGDLGQNGTGIKIELNRTYHCTGELKIEWSTGEQEIYSIDSNFTPTNYNTSVLLPNFSWEGIGISTQTFQHMNLDFQSSSANGYKIFMRPTTANVITKSGVLLNGSYYQISVTSDGFNTINLNLSDDPKFQAIYKSLAYRSVIASSAPGVSEWCDSLSSFKTQQFAGQPFSGDFVFNNVSSIDYYVFGSVYTGVTTGDIYIWNCSFPSCTKIENGTFYCNGGIKEVYFPNCTSIGSYTFYNCTRLTTVSFPNCTSIGASAFFSCKNLSEASFPDCTSISPYAFQNCIRLTTVSFPSCTSIGASAFYNCTSLANISFPNCSYIAMGAFNICSALIAASFPNCSYIANGAFSNCCSLSNISFPSCTTISSYAFYNCHTLTTANFPNCTYIGTSAFYSCSALTTANFPSCNIISNYAFIGCSALTTASFPSCTKIGTYAFYGCSELTTVSFPNCTSIDNNAFYGCSELTTVSFPNCTSINQYAFRYCSNLSSFYFMGSSIPSIMLYTFSNTTLSLSSYLGYFGSIYVPASLLASYQTATYWSLYSARMVGI